jgi:hypothetical protein
MTAHLPLQTIGLLDRTHNYSINNSNMCTLMHLFDSYLSQIRTHLILNILSSRASSILGMHASTIRGFCRSCKALFYRKAHCHSCYCMNYPTDSMAGSIEKFFPEIRGIYSLLLRSANDLPNSNFSTLNNHNLKNRPFINPSRGRSIRQGGRLGDTYRRYQHVIKYIN